MREDWIDKLAAGDPATLARCISAMEGGGPVADRIHRRIARRSGARR
jgi:hypothetical protein